MAKTQWTPGPWREDGWYVVVSDEPIRRIAVEGRTDVEAMSNARLIAAAPELYDALELLLTLDTDCGTEGCTCMNARFTAMARAALAKARGEA